MEIAAIIAVFFLLAVAAITFVMLKKAVKMAFRAAIVALILLIAIVGGASLWMFSGEKTADTRNAPAKKVR
jgi:flagellar basal body-associated protein FliL